MSTYSMSFFDALHQQVRDSAREIVPIVTRLLHPARVADVGCGTGTWLAAFLEHGAADVRGFDGDYIDRRALEIPHDRFVAVDLERPVALEGRYDLVLCLEVAEHLPPSRATSLVDALTDLAPVVLFSAAIPLQGGVNHVNEQWPEYWAAQFARRGFVVIDCLRRQIWRNEKVAWFYAQNIMLYAHEQYVKQHPALSRELSASQGLPLALVHPSCFLMRVWGEHDLAQRPIRELLAALPSLSRQALARRLHWHRPAAS